MAIRLSSYLKRNRFGIYYFRRVIPPDVRAHFAFREVSRSTGTSRRCEALIIARRCAVTFEELCDRLSDMAKKKKNDDDGKVFMVVTMNFHKDGGLSNFKLDAKPEESCLGEQRHRPALGALRWLGTCEGRHLSLLVGAVSLGLAGPRKVMQRKGKPTL